MSTKYISVITSRPREVKAYLYSYATIRKEWLSDTSGRSGLLIAVEVSDEDRVQFLADYQADRLLSGMHGAKVHDTWTDAEAHLLTLI